MMIFLTFIDIVLGATWLITDWTWAGISALVLFVLLFLIGAAKAGLLGETLENVADCMVFIGDGDGGSYGDSGGYSGGGDSGGSCD